MSDNGRMKRALKSPKDSELRQLEELRQVIARPNFIEFRDRFQELVSSLGGTGRVPAALALLGSEAFETFLDNGALDDPQMLAWFVEQSNAGCVDLTPGLSAALRRAQRALTQRTARRRGGELAGRHEVIQLKRVVQLSWFGIAGFEASDAFAIRRSIFRSPQERTFARALSLRFPGLAALPNYPFDQIADLDKLRAQVTTEAWRYGRMCRLDAILVTPVEGDPIAAFELDSAVHEPRWPLQIPPLMASQTPPCRTSGL